MKSNNPFYSLAHTYTLQKQAIIGLTYIFSGNNLPNLPKKIYFTLPSFQFWVVLTSSHLGRVYHSKFKMVLPFIHISIVSYLPDCYREMGCKSDSVFFAHKILPQPQSFCDLFNQLVSWHFIMYHICLFYSLTQHHCIPLIW